MKLYFLKLFSLKILGPIQIIDSSERELKKSKGMQVWNLIFNFLLIWYLRWLSGIIMGIFPRRNETISLMVTKENFFDKKAKFENNWMRTNIHRLKAGEREGLLLGFPSKVFSFKLLTNFELFLEELKSENTFPINQFNLYVSDRISINRSLPDIRKTTCREKTYSGSKLYFLEFQKENFRFGKVAYHFCYHCLP